MDGHVCILLFLFNRQEGVEAQVVEWQAEVEAEVVKWQKQKLQLKLHGRWLKTLMYASSIWVTEAGIELKL